MKELTYEMIKSWNPCYEPIKHIPETWSGTPVDLLRRDDIPFDDRFWVVLRKEIASERIMRLFAVWCYRQTLKFIENPDPRSVAAADTSERYANEEATQEELDAAYAAAWTAAETFRFASEAAYSAARSSAYSAARSAAWAAYYAARSAASSAARSAYSAAWSAAESAASSAASSAESAAWSAAWSAESAQRDKLIEMIEIEGKKEIL